MRRPDDDDILQVQSSWGRLAEIVAETRRPRDSTDWIRLDRTGYRPDVLAEALSRARRTWSDVDDAHQEELLVERLALLGAEVLVALGDL